MAAKERDTDNNEFTFTNADLAQFEERRKKRLSGESKTSSWEEAKDIITGNSKSDLCKNKNS